MTFRNVHTDAYFSVTSDVSDLDPCVSSYSDVLIDVRLITAYFDYDLLVDAWRVGKVVIVGFDPSAGDSLPLQEEVVDIWLQPEWLRDYLTGYGPPGELILPVLEHVSGMTVKH